LDVTCAISGKGKKSTLSIIIRQSVEEISHKFGSLQLLLSDDTDDVDLFGWASQAAEQRDALTAELRSTNTRVEKAEEVIKSLQTQLQELVKAKEEHETQLLSKFALLLNEKKLKIRSQQHQIASQPAPSMSRSAASAQNTRKRKHLDNAVPDDASESDGFDEMDVDRDEVANEDDSDAARRTSSESDTASEPEVPSPLASGPEKSSSKDTEIVPPPRELPFGIKAKPYDDALTKPIATQPPSDDEETASEDDEL
jgi:hypothetical protein